MGDFPDAFDLYGATPYDADPDEDGLAPAPEPAEAAPIEQPAAAQPAVPDPDPAAAATGPLLFGVLPLLEVVHATLLRSPRLALDGAWSPAAAVASEAVGSAAQSTEPAPPVPIADLTGGAFGSGSPRASVPPEAPFLLDFRGSEWER